MTTLRLYRLLRILACLVAVKGQFSEMASFPINGTGKCLDVSEGYLEDLSGNRYDLGMLSPSENVLVPSLPEGGPVSIYRHTYAGGQAILLAQKDSLGSIVYAKLSGPSQSSPVHFVKTRDCHTDDELFVFAESQIHDVEYQDQDLGDETNASDPIDDWDGETRSEHIYVAGDSSSLECRFFKVVKVGIVYDSDFCRKYGGHTEAKSRIMLIVAAASLLYENDMCLKLKLVGIYTPDDDCNEASVFASMPRDEACGSGTTSETFIRYFADWMNENRNATGMKADTVVHAFTGAPPRGTLGCAYTGSFCRTPKYMYGLGYMGSSFLSSQSVIFAHELGHNLNARHLTSEEAGNKRYIMKASLQNPNDGFDVLSAERILNFLDLPEVTCDGVSSSTSSPRRPQTFPPFRSPSRKPTPRPSRKPTRRPSPKPTRKPSQDSGSNPASTTTPRSSEECGFEVAEVESLCFNETEELFGCIEAVDLVSIRLNQSCKDSNTVIDGIALTSCENVESSNEEGGRVLNPLQVMDGNEAGDTTSEFLLSSTGADSSHVDESSVERTLVSFASSHCEKLGCTAVKNYICFATTLESNQNERIYRLGFEAYIDGHLAHGTSVVRVKQSNDAEGCLTPKTVCLSQ